MAEIPDDVVVTQEDRDRAVALLALLGLNKAVESVEDSHWLLVQAFAAHRIAAEEKAKAHWLEEAAKVVKSKMKVWFGKRSVLALEDASAAIRSLGEQE